MSDTRHPVWKDRVFGIGRFSIGSVLGYLDDNFYFNHARVSFGTFNIELFGWNWQGGLGSTGPHGHSTRGFLSCLLWGKFIERRQDKEYDDIRTDVRTAPDIRSYPPTMIHDITPVGRCLSLRIHWGETGREPTPLARNEWSRET